MFKLKLILTLITFTLITSFALAKAPKEDVIVTTQNLINQTYKLGYADAAPIEMAKVEKKMEALRVAKDKSKKKIIVQLVDEIKLDLRIVKKRHEVNELHQQLETIQAKNLKSKILLDDLKGQI